MPADIEPPGPTNEPLRVQPDVCPSLAIANNVTIEAVQAERDHFRTAYEQASAEHDELITRHASVLNERDTLKAEMEKLQLAIKQLIRARYGRKSERIDPEQLQLALEGLEQDAGAVAAAQEAAETPVETKTRTRRPPQRNRGHLPAHLERYEVVLDVADKTCPCCGGAMHVIDEDVAEQLDVVPLRFRVRVTRRPRYGCRACAEAVIQVPAPERPIPGGMATEALIAQVAVSKYGDGLPLYRQAQIHARDGIDLDRSIPAFAGTGYWPTGAAGRRGG